jgi:signal transduction histidine kinase
MWFNVQIAAYASLAVGYGLLLLLVFRHRNGRGQAQRRLEGVLLAASLWTLVLGVMAILISGGWWSFVWRRVAEIGLVILALLTAGFTDVFLQRPSNRWVRLGPVLFAVLVAIVVDALPANVLPNALTHWTGPVELASWLWRLAWFWVTATTWWAALAAHRSATGSKHRNRIRYLLASLLVFAIGDALLLIGGVPDVYVGLVARLLGLAVVTFAVLQYDLPDLRRLVLGGLRYAIIWSLTVFLYLAAVMLAGWIWGVVSGIPYRSTFTWAMALALLLAAGIDVLLRPSLRRWLDRLLLGRRYDPQKALRAYGDKIAGSLNIERVVHTTLDWLAGTLGVERAMLFEFKPQDNGGVKLTVLGTTAGPLPPAITFGEGSQFIAHFHRQDRPLSQYDVDMLTWFQLMPVAERQWLKDLALDLYVPIRIKDEPAGVLALGAKAGGQPYSDKDLETLMLLSFQTGSALDNARQAAELFARQADIHHLTSVVDETKRQLDRLDQTKKDFVSIASHELRTPMAQIYGFTDLLTSMTGDEMSDGQELGRLIQGISRGARRLKQVVDAMVDASLIDAGALALRTASFPPLFVVSNAVSTIRPAAEGRGQTIVLEDLSGLPTIKADAARLEQVLSGLLRNAVKFTPDGGQITVSGLVIGSAGTDYVELQVADTGIGIDPDQRELIFGKFYRSEDTMRHSTDDTGFKGAGPGLGLAIARGIVDAHDGRIWVESPGRDEETCPGSTFHVRLPVNGPKAG